MTWLDAQTFLQAIPKLRAKEELSMLKIIAFPHLNKSEREKIEYRLKHLIDENHGSIDLINLVRSQNG